VKEIRMGNAVILQDDAILYLIKEPVNSATNPHLAAVVNLAIAPLNSTGPINLPLNQLPSCPHLSRFLRAAWVRPITGDKHPGGFHGADGVDHLLGGVGASPGKEEDGSPKHHKYYFLKITTETLQILRELITV
jgi:hypothetical protein